VPGVYVPLLYRVEYHSPTGPIADVSPLQLPAGSTNVSSSSSSSSSSSGAGMLLAAPAVVERQTYRGKQLATSTVVSPRMAWEGIYMVEVVRSCPEVCRFCLASYSSLPFRPAALEDHLIPAIERGLQVTNRIGLLGASVTQHPQFDSLLSYLLQPHMKGIRLSIASVRTNTVTAKLAAALAQSGTRSLTIAVESGSERMRRVVNKKLDSADIIAAAVNAQEGGLSGLKLYGMVGLPSETDADVGATVAMMSELRKAAPRLKLTLGCSTFVPKAHTPFQWQPVQAAAEGRLRVLEKAMRKVGVEFRPESYKWSMWQAVLSRGDRRLSKLLQQAREFGGSQGSFGRAFKEMKGHVPPPEYYAFRLGAKPRPSGKQVYLDVSHCQLHVDQTRPGVHLQCGGSQGSFGRALKEMRGQVPPPEYYAFRLVGLLRVWCEGFWQQGAKQRPSEKQVYGSDPPRGAPAVWGVAGQLWVRVQGDEMKGLLPPPGYYAFRLVGVVGGVVGFGFDMLLHDQTRGATAALGARSRR
ncbi:unnamed protein product, partial [Closterium sp. NIES-54]